MRRMARSSSRRPTNQQTKFAAIRTGRFSDQSIWEKPSIHMDKKAKKRIELLRKKIGELQPRLAGAKKQMDDPEEVRKLQAELAAAQAEVEKLKQS
jgi:hypothetical protein